MTSGIYKLEFKSGEIYIGKSDNIERRWEQHMYDMQKGKHTKRIQEAFNIWGVPEHKILLVCHKDHIDLMEAIEISKYYHLDSCLNGNQPSLPPPEEIALLKQYKEYLIYSTAQHLQSMAEAVASKKKAKKEAKRANKEIEDLNSNGIVLEANVVKQLEELKNTIKSLNRELELSDKCSESLHKELTTLKSRGLFARIFNL